MSRKRFLKKKPIYKASPIRERPAKQEEGSQNHKEPPEHENGKGATSNSLGVQDASNCDDHQAAERRFWERQVRIAYWLNGITAGAAIVALIGLLFVYLSLMESKKVTLAAEKQAEAAANANINATDALHQSQRPWVVADNMDPIGRSISGGTTLTLSIKNVGTSIATNGRVWFGSQPNNSKYLDEHWRKACIDLDTMRKAENSAPLEYSGWPLGFVLAPGELKTEHISFGEAAYMSIVRDGDVVRSLFFIMGCIQYTDQFKIEHTSYFCFQNGGAAGDDRIALEKCGGFFTAD